MKFLGLVKYHFLCLVREPIILFFGFGFPVLILLMTPSMEGVNIVDAAFASIILSTVMTLCFMDSGFSHAYSRQIKFLRRLRMTPVSSKGYIAAGLLTRYVVVLAFATGIIVVASVASDLELAGRNWPLFYGVLTAAFMMFYLFGMFVANILKGAKQSQSLLYVVFFGMLVLGGFMLPTQFLPDIVQDILYYLPSTQAILAVDGVWRDTSELYWQHLAYIGGGIVVFGALAVKVFKYE